MERSTLIRIKFFFVHCMIALSYFLPLVPIFTILAPTVEEQRNKFAGRIDQQSFHGLVSRTETTDRDARV